MSYFVKLSAAAPFSDYCILHGLECRFVIADWHSGHKTLFTYSVDMDGADATQMQLSFDGIKITKNLSDK